MKVKKAIIASVFLGLVLYGLHEQFSEIFYPLVFGFMVVLPGMLFFISQNSWINRFDESLKAREAEIKATKLCTKSSSVIGSFNGRNIYNFVNVSFSNGITIIYKFVGTSSTMDVTQLPAAHLMDQGIIYAPVGI